MDTASSDPNSNPQRRVLGRPFPKGVSGNPSGRPKRDPTLQEICRMLKGKTIQVVAGLLDSNDEKVRLAAVTAVWDRGWGRPPQAVALAVDDASGANLARSRAILAAGFGRLAGLAAEPDPAFPEDPQLAAERAGDPVVEVEAHAITASRFPVEPPDATGDPEVPQGRSESGGER